MIYLNGQFNINPNESFGDKSLSHRLLILGSIASGKCIIRNLSLCRDVLSTVDCLRKLGASIEIEGTQATVCPIKNPCVNVVLDCGNSGTTARLVAGLVAGLGVSATFVGDKQLSRRPMDGLVAALRALGAKIDYSDGCLFRIFPSHLVGAHVTAKNVSAQIKSAVLIAGLFADGETVYEENVATRNHTELLLKNLGASISAVDGVIAVKPSKVSAFSVTVPNDISSAAYIVALAVTSKQSVRLGNLLLNPRRMGFVHLLQKSGAAIDVSVCGNMLGEPIGTVSVEPSMLLPINADEQSVTDAIDEIPLLACLACCANGTSHFSGVSQLAYKESNRIQAIIGLVKTMGQKVESDGESLTVISNGVLPKNPRFAAYSDHRIEMCGVVMSLLCGGGFVDGIADINISFPQFFSAVGVSFSRFALVGSGIEYSLSPMLHTHFASKVGVSCNYELCDLPCDVTDVELLSAISCFDGVNVTIPFKTRVARLLKSNLPSVNVVDGNTAYSTDGYGLLKALDSCGFAYKNAPLWVIGAGGAAEAALQALLPFGAKIQLFNRTAEHANVLLQKYNLCTVDNPVGILSFVPQCDFLQTVQIPPSVKFVFSASYNGKNALLETACLLGLQTSDGLEMLYHQGAKSFAIWTKTPVQDDFNGFLSIINGTK